MSDNSNKKRIILEICLGVLVTVILLAVALIIVSIRKNESPVTVSESETSETMDFKPETSYEINLGVGESCKAELTDGSTEHLVWVSSNSDIATVDDDGNITGVSAGTCNVTVFIMDIDESIGVSVTVE